MGEPTDNMVTSSIDGLNSVVGSTAFEMHEGVVPGDVLYETSIFLESLVRSATSGEVRCHCSSNNGSVAAALQQ